MSFQPALATPPCLSQTWRRLEQRALLVSPFDQMVEILSIANGKALFKPYEEPEPVVTGARERVSLTGRYTVADIIESMKACQAAKEPEVVTADSGVIQHGPLANEKRSWKSVSDAMRAIWLPVNAISQCNGLTRSNCPHKSLAELRKACGLDTLDYSFSAILMSYKACHEAVGLYPTQTSGIITHGSLANGKRTWKSVDGALAYLWQDGHEDVMYKGLTRSNCPCRSLSEVRRFYQKAVAAGLLKTAMPPSPE